MTALNLASGIRAFAEHHAHNPSQKAVISKQLSIESVNDAEWSRSTGNVPKPLLVKPQILLDRAHASPGQIDGNRGESTRKAVGAFREMRDIGRPYRWSELPGAGDRPLCRRSNRNARMGARRRSMSLLLIG
jgi:peptidoglycan hydrolase-like protein with peptidoglycan-binding domain